MHGLQSCGRSSPLVKPDRRRSRDSILTAQGIVRVRLEQGSDGLSQPVALVSSAGCGPDIVNRAAELAIVKAAGVRELAEDAHGRIVLRILPGWALGKEEPALFVVDHQFDAQRRPPPAL